MTTIDPVSRDAGIAAVDLRNYQWMFVTRDATGKIIPATAGSTPLFVLEFPADVGKTVTFITMGKAKVVCAGTIPANGKVKCDANSKAVAALSTDNAAGWLTEAAVANQVAQIQLDQT